MRRVGRKSAGTYLPRTTSPTRCVDMPHSAMLPSISAEAPPRPATGREDKTKAGRVLFTNTVVLFFFLRCAAGQRLASELEHSRPTYGNHAAHLASTIAALQSLQEELRQTRNLLALRIPELQPADSQGRLRSQQRKVCRREAHIDKLYGRAAEACSQVDEGSDHNHLMNLRADCQVPARRDLPAEIPTYDLCLCTRYLQAHHGNG